MSSCDLLVDGVWQELASGKAQDLLRLAAMIGLRIENRQKKLQELADHLSHLFGVTATVAGEASRTPQGYRKLAHPIDVRYTIPGEGGVHTDIEVLRVEGIIRLQDHVIDSVEVLHHDTVNSHYMLGYTIAGKAIDSVWTHRRRRSWFSGELKSVEWKGGPLANQLNSDVTLQELLLRHLGNPDCDAYITTDELNGNTMIILGDSYPRQWGKLPRKLFPTEERKRIVTLLGQKIRSL